VWKSYKITINGTDEVYYVQDKNDEAYAEFEFTDYGTARYSFWDDGEESNARALIKRVMSKASQASTFTSIPLSYQINGYTVYVYERTSGVGLTLNYNQSEKALVLSSDITGDEGQVYTFNLFFRK
jgi:hypothetical protein